MVAVGQTDFARGLRSHHTQFAKARSLGGAGSVVQLDMAHHTCQHDLEDCYSAAGSVVPFELSITFDARRQDPRLADSGCAITPQLLLITLQSSLGMAT